MLQWGNSLPVLLCVHMADIQAWPMGTGLRGMRNCQALCSHRLLGRVSALREDRLTGVVAQAQAHPPPWGLLEWNPRQTDASSTCRTVAATRLAARGLPCFRAPCASSRAVCTSRGPGWVSTYAGAAASGCSRKGVPALLQLLSSCSPVSEAAATRSASVLPPAAAHPHG